jgi:ribonuclease HI
MNKIITIYTDGSCLYNGSKNAIGGCGIYIMYTSTNNIICGKKYSFNYNKIINKQINKNNSSTINNLDFNAIKIPTNQKTELLAIILGLKLILKINNKLFKKNNNNIFNSKVQNENLRPLLSDYEINIITDSKYSINCINKWNNKWKINNWMTSKKKSVENKYFIKKIDNILNNINNLGGKVNFKHVKSHTKKNDTQDWIGNDIADKLAKNGLKMIKK